MKKHGDKERDGDSHAEPDCDSNHETPAPAHSDQTLVYLVTHNGLLPLTHLLGHAVKLGLVDFERFGGSCHALLVMRGPHRQPHAGRVGGRWCSFKGPCFR